MSRFYEALNRWENTAACPVLDAIEAEAEESCPAASAHDETIPAGPQPVPDSAPERDDSDVAAAASVHRSASERKPEAGSPANPGLALRRAAFRKVSLALRTHTPVLPFDGADPDSAEEYRLLRTRLLHHPSAPRMIVVSSASPGDGKTVTAINIAGILALRSDMRILLVDADLRRSSVARMLGISPGPGMSDVLRGECLLDEAIVCTAELTNLHVIPSGATPPNPAELLDSGLWKSVMANLRNRFDYVIVDSTPMAAVADFELVQAVCDGIVVVIRPDHTNRKLLDSALKRQSADRILGVVINGIQEWPFSKTEKSYYGDYRRFANGGPRRPSASQ